MGSQCNSLNTGIMWPCILVVMGRVGCSFETSKGIVAIVEARCYQGVDYCLGGRFESKFVDAAAWVKMEKVRFTEGGDLWLEVKVVVESITKTSTNHQNFYGEAFVLIRSFVS